MNGPESAKSLPNYSDESRAFLENLYGVHQTGSVLVLVTGGMIC